jgi:Diacylglycerol acyltransferase
LIFIGGEKEQLMTMPGEHKVFLRNRKGFVKLAIEYGTPLVPMVSFEGRSCPDHLCWSEK